MEILNSVARIIVASLIGAVLVSAVIALHSVARKNHSEVDMREGFLSVCTAAGAHPGQCLSILLGK